MPDPPTPSSAFLRRAIRLSHVNALVWAVGNGLLSTTLVVYLALELGAQGIAISWILASPRLAGLFRLAAPALIHSAAARWVGGRKAICIGSYALSALTLVLVPMGAIGAGAHGARWGVGVLVIAWCVYHLIEYTATIALWSWLGDLYPARLQSRIIGRRERWLVVGRMIGMGVSLALATLWGWTLSDADRWAPLAASASIGAVLMLLAATVLLRVPSMGHRPSARVDSPWRTLRRALAERPYRRLLTYSCAFGVANGLTGSAQAMYPQRVLGLAFEHLLVMRAGMRAGQAALAPSAGVWIDRVGAKPVMVAAQLLVALGPLFFLIATPEAPWWVAGAFVVWVAYALLNVGLDTLKLRLADATNTAPYLTMFYALSDLANAVTILIGGMLYETLTAGNERSLEVFAWLFLTGWVLRTLTAGLILRLEDRPT